MAPPDHFRTETLVAVEAVERGLELVRGRVGAAEVTSKAERDIVTATDVAVEDAVRAAVGDTLAFVGEESGDDASVSSYWLVDPICGTRNFASGIPLYCVNVALVEDGEVAAAVVGDPAGEIYAAERGRGAWTRDGDGWRRIAASDESRTVVVEDSHADGERRERAAAFVAALIRADRWDLRSLSTTLSLVYVATGKVAAYVLFWTSAVHAGAGSLLAAEAGAAVSDIDGRPWNVASDSIVATATPSLHRELLGG